MFWKLNPLNLSKKHVPTYLHLLQSFEINSSFLNTVLEENQDNGQGPKLKVIQYGWFQYSFHVITTVCCEWG